MIRIVVADDHHLVRQSILALLEQAEDIEVVGEASNGHEALTLTQQKLPDVVLVDIAMPRLNGLETTYKIHALGVDTRVIILSMYSDESVVRQALRNGARGYLLKSSDVDELLLAIRSVAVGEIFLSPMIARSVMAHDLRAGSATGSSTVVDRLSSREREIMQLIVEGNTNRSVAEILGISIKTVEKHRASLMRKLGVRDIPDLIQVALKHHLVFPDGHSL